MPIVSKEALGDLVYDQMVKMMLNGDLPPGKKIQKKELANILGVSITPVSVRFLSCRTQKKYSPVEPGASNQESLLLDRTRCT